MSNRNSNDTFRYKFSVIIPVYQVEDYLEETLLSVIHQSIGFENIQIILVNDGSPDESGKICEKYAKRYPDNIVYVEQENAGVSEARNKGMEYMEGKYVNFLDSDDKWSKDAFREAADFFEKHGDTIDIVAGRIQYFEKKTDYHVLDYKFEQDKLVDIFQDYDFVQLSMATTFVRADALKGKKFDKRIRYGEDCILINTILLEKCKYGVLRNCVYQYRMRNTGTSAMQNTVHTKSWYFETEELVFMRLLEMSREKFGKVIDYIGYLVMYDTKWRLRASIPEGILTQEEQRRYKDNLVKILSQIDDKLIMEQKQCTSLHYKLAFDMKYRTDIGKEVTFDKGLISFRGNRLTHLAKRKFLTIDFIEVKEHCLYLTGQADYWLPEEDYEIFFADQAENRYALTYFPLPHRVRRGLCGIYGNARGFQVEIPLENVSRLKCIFVYKGEKECSMYPAFGKFAKLSHQLEHSYGIYGSYILKSKGKTISIQKRTRRRYKSSEKKFCKELRKEKKYKVLFYRYVARLYKKLNKKKIWLISDRINLARDNGEALFKYLNTFDTKDIRPYFAISSHCEDYKRMKKYGKVVPHASLRYKLMFLAADKIISAHIDEYVINAFETDREYMKNMYQFQYVFLQHGLTKDDLSGWVNKFNKNIDLFITAAKPEYQSILEGNYFYTEKEVKLTGFPRYDSLVKSETRKQIIILPTWRKELANAIDQKTGERLYNPAFKETEYFQFYNRLIHDERLLTCMRKRGYTGKFCLHINHMEQMEDFQGNDVIEIHQGNLDYQKEFRENALMVTDYSSVAFDFAYMKKSLVYAQFDREAFFAGQTYDEGYFDYETDGFGPVCYDYETTVAALIDAVTRNCLMEKKYQDRVDDFYYKTDTKNSERVYQAICAMDAK